ncbi:hypothetical protein QTG56_07300 [Rossellomorea sp. AcN35-11]|nr:hypothetical protein [Rossellomorea aquimaris]WJV30822.1 hypothetical protein QTG56_07300 [Rossellomorea sp. AcN35-11]
MNLKKITNIMVALASRVMGTALQFLLNIVLGRVLGAGGLGNYYTFVSWTNIVGTVSSLGLPLYLLNKIPQKNNFNEIKYIFKRSLILVFTAGMILSLLMYIYISYIGEFSNNLNFLISYSLLAGVSLALIRIVSDSLKAINKYNIGLGLEFSTIPLLLLILIMILFSLGIKIHVNLVLLLYLIISGCAIIIGVTVFNRLTTNLQKERKYQGDFRIFPKRDIKQIFTFLGILLVNNSLASAPYLILPFLVSLEEVGEFGVAHRLVSLSGTILIALAAYFTPQFSKNSKTLDGFKDYKHSQIFSFLTYFPLFIIYILFSDIIISLFGEGFKDAKVLLLIMAFGRLVNAGFGLGEQFLNMNGMEHIEFKNGIFTLFVFLLLSFLLNEKYGIIGITTSYAFAFALRAIVSYFVILRLKNRLA